jgi:GTPase SAR1 family protein
VNITHISSVHVLCFDLSDKSTFNQIDTWIVYLRERYPEIRPIILLGVNSSKNRVRFQSLDFFEKYSKERKLIAYFEVNVELKKSLNVLFEFISRIEIEKKVKSIIAMRKLIRYSNEGEVLVEFEDHTRSILVYTQYTPGSVPQKLVNNFLANYQELTFEEKEEKLIKMTKAMNDYSFLYLK